MAQETNQTQVPMLCATGCGFYGNPRTNGMCSVCYKDFVQRQNSNGRVSPPAPSGVSSLGESLPVQCSEGNPADVTATLTQTATPLEQSSIVTRQTLLSQASLTNSEEDDSTGDKTGLKTEELHGIEGTETPVNVTVCKEVSKGKEDCPLGLLDRAAISEKDTGSECMEDSSKRPKRKLDETGQILNGMCASVSDDSDQASSEGLDRSPEKPKQKKNRCFICRKKVGLTGFDCRCGNLFCGIHRYSDIHNCTFDYKADAAEKIRKENPVVVGEKIQKI
ncbi:AN1-type zinc finger protein 6 isoform X2 [Lepisosteus oculatus]|nr:PREDICTED: AN1-type zinc finger protein 6 isoform X2 [Lepisosteus oculatus]XP_015198383.1 PREDICTED: AN1-type zinc finger protein 6 isoform X2 [Lepisosteus oculatus]XP_015198384.1 PREDICTED: AN1-type zinc finger protein 6 isoform X2 [Lepisosteus oculatus]XP_015198385.1 PREDICTED: AN1-type zinc finger protein 6 isoform X2 [Lepisosteus oculatus]XP_015198386.1 PREDICTED: AN1-type zinc finger protein 6 isoform X2 [Lepisosteus oculatus]